MNLFCVSNFNWGSKGFVVETVLGQNIFGFKNLFSFLDKLVWGQDFYGKNVGSKNNRLRDPTIRDRLIWVQQIPIPIYYSCRYQYIATDLLATDIDIV